MNKSSHAQAGSPEVWQRPFVRAHHEWCDAFVLELRLRDVPGPVIGERLAEVEGHCAEAGEPPSAAFGDPADYARQIYEESSPERVSGVWTIAALAAGQVVAMLVGTGAVQTWARGEQLAYTLLQLICLALVALLLLCLPRLLRPLLAHPWVVGTGLVILVTAAAVVPKLAGPSGSTTTLSVPPAVVAIGLFAVVLALSWIQHHELRRDAANNPVTSPLQPSPRTDPATHQPRRSMLLPSALIPVAYLALGATAWLSV